MNAAANTPRMIADIGGTNARFALLDGMHTHDEVVLTCADYPDLISAAEQYLRQVDASDGARRPREAALAIAGPVESDLIAMTNHVWSFSIADTREQLRLDRLLVLNDFTALAMAVRHLPAHELQQIGGDHPAPGRPLAVLGPGTGLGVSGVIPTGEHWLALQGEGGHVTLSVMTARELAVLEQLQQRFDHVSAERVLSGPGLENLYAALCALESIAPQALTAPQITERARQRSCPLCQEAVAMFCALLGTLAGNVVLTLGAMGGVYIGGGIVPALGDVFAASAFRERFEAKGRFSRYLASVPAFVIRSELPALLGLARAFQDPGPRWEAV